MEFGNDDHGRLIASMAPCSFRPDYDRVISRTCEGNFLGGVIYQDEIPGGMITMHAGAPSPRWFSREMAWTIFAYPFLQLKVNVIVITIASTNTHSLQFCTRLGFVEEHRIQGAVPGGDMVILSMRKSGCRWITGLPPKGFLKGTPS